MVSVQNLLTLSLAANGPMVDAVPSLSEIRIGGLQGVELGVTGSTIALEDSGLQSIGDGLFCIDGTATQRFNALWNSSIGEIIFQLCTGTKLEPDTVYSISMLVNNPSASRAAPSLSITALAQGGIVLLDWVPLTKPSMTPSSAAFVSLGFADPFFVVNTGFSRLQMVQSSALPSSQNTLSITMQANMDVFLGSSELAIASSVTDSAPAFIISGLTHADSSTDVVLISPLESSVSDGAVLFCSASNVEKRAVWSQTGHQLHLTMCSGAKMWRGEIYVFSLNVVNPSSPQASPPIFIDLVGGTSWTQTAFGKTGNANDPLFVCEDPMCSVGSYAASCSECTPCPSKTCPAGETIVVEGCTALSGGDCVSCTSRDANAIWSGTDCICRPGFYGDGVTCFECPDGQTSLQGSTASGDCTPVGSSAFKVSMEVRLEGTKAQFDDTKQQQFLGAVQRASPSASTVLITSITEVTAGRRRLLASYLDIGLELQYPSQALAESAAANDLSESSLNAQMAAEGLGSLTITVEPTVSAIGDEGEQPTAAPDTQWLTAVVLAVVGMLALGIALALWYRRRYHRLLDRASI